MNIQFTVITILNVHKKKICNGNFRDTLETGNIKTSSFQTQTYVRVIY